MVCEKNHNFNSVPIVLAYEVWTPLISPNYFEDISLFIDKKMEALKKHKTQEAEKYEKAYRGMNAFQGMMHEEKTSAFSEAFQILRMK